MTKNREAFAKISFKKRGNSYQGSVDLRDLALLPGDPAETMRVVTAIYEKALAEIRHWQRDVKTLRQSKTPLPAWKAWELGDIVHRLQADLSAHACQLENLYDHLARHAGTFGWLRQFVTFRRYVDNAGAIPDGLRWNSIAKRSRTAGLSIAAGLPLED